MSQAELHVIKRFDGNKRLFPIFKRTFESELASKKILWTIQSDESDPTKPTSSITRVETGKDVTDHDYRVVEKYEKIMKTRKEDCEQAISVLERSLGPVPLARIDEILTSSRLGPRRIIKMAYEKLIMLYAADTDAMVDRIEDDFFKLPMAHNPEEVIKLLDNMVSLNAEIRRQDPDSVWNGSKLKKFLNKRVKLPDFAAVKDRCSTEMMDWSATENAFRSVAEREILTAFSVSEGAVQTKTTKRPDGASMQEFTNTIAAALASQSSSSRTCWNCNQVGHYLRDCMLGMCRTCSAKGDKSNHNPSECPNYLPKTREKKPYNNNSTQSSATTLGGTKGNRFQAKINAALEDNDSDEHDVKRSRNDDDKSDSLWDRIKKGIEADSDDSNYNSSYLHPLSMHISTSTAKLICTSLSTTERFTSNNRVLLDSGASISLCTALTAERYSLKTHKLKRPIPLMFGNNTKSYSRSWCNGGPLLGIIYIAEGLAITLISTTELARRSITFFNGKEYFGLLDQHQKVIIRSRVDDKARLPLMNFSDILDIDTCQFTYERFKEESGKYLHSYALTNVVRNIVKRTKQPKVSEEQYKEVIYLHERMFHCNPSVMATAIRNEAWTGTKIDPSLISKVFRHYDCEACAKAKRNKEAVQIGTQIPVANIGVCLSVDRVPVNTPDLGGHTGFYSIVDESKGYLLIFLDKHFDLIGCLEKTRLFYQRHNIVVRRLRFDAGSVENSIAVSNYLSRYDVQIDPQPAAVDEQNQNTVERYIQHLNNVVSACMEGADEVTPSFWGLCVLGFATIHNYTPNTASGTFSPHYHLTGKHPDISATCKFPFGQLVTVAKTNQEMRGMFKFNTKNDIGLAVGSVTYNNNSTYVYIPSHTGTKMVFPRINVRAINAAPKEWTQAGNTSAELPTLDIHPLAVIDPSDGIPVSRLSNSIVIDPPQVLDQHRSNDDVVVESTDIIPIVNDHPNSITDYNVGDADSMQVDDRMYLDTNDAVVDVGANNPNQYQSRKSETFVNGEEFKDQGEVPTPRPRSPIRMLTHPTFDDDAIIQGETIPRQLSHTGQPRSPVRMLQHSPLRRNKSSKVREPSGEDLILHTVRVRKLPAKLIGVVEDMAYFEDAVCVFAVQASPGDSTQSSTPTLKEALASGHKILWIKAIETEFKTLHELDTYEEIAFEDIPAGANVIPTKMVLRVKVTSAGEYIKHKARLVVIGCRDRMVLSDLFAPTASSKSVSLIICLVVALGLFMCGLDVYGAFLIPEIKRNVYVALPKLLCGNKPVYWKLKRTLYGLADSPIEFYKHVSGTLSASGFKCTISDPCVFIKRESKSRYIIAVIYVDDFIVAGTHMDLIDELKADLRKKYTITEAPELESFIGIHLSHNKNGSVTISQPGFIRGLLEEHDMLDSGIALTPMTSTFNDQFQDDSDKLGEADKLRFMSILGSLIFLLRTRPDIAYAVNRMATRTCRATNKDLCALGRILKYLNGTIELGLTFNPSKREDLTTIFCWVDAAYACHLDGKSHSGYCFSLGSHHTGKFYCRSAKQANVTTSSTEAECDALKEAAKEIEWMRFMMEELGFPQPEPTMIYEDNMSTIVLATKFSGNMKRVKHMMQTIHYILDLYRRSVINISHINTQDQIADMLTKALPSAEFLKFRELLMGEKYKDLEDFEDKN